MLVFDGQYYDGIVTGPLLSLLASRKARLGLTAAFLVHENLILSESQDLVPGAESLWGGFLYI